MEPASKERENVALYRSSCVMNDMIGGGLGGVSGFRVRLWVAGSGMGRLCLGERLGVSTALCPPG